MGTRHGAYCAGCCWCLMGLLFLGGVMNRWWIAGLALFVALEKLGPAGDAVRRVTGPGLSAFGVWLLSPAW
jgi:predicted metal-binding membrane protein